ncbi:MAG: endonuclease [Muricauda sp.]|nr:MULTISPECIES: YraN family protein [unclassified Allomuricauda]MAU15032.1 endonuclease [Allomuricauda sp.]|tara:strand:+ start:171 stop:530 length:360 start_codon:yes stop_codon:yes gene_type:complete
MGNHNQFGELGEQKAVAFLRGKGYTILERNYRYLKAEVDIIAQKEDLLAIVEVKSRNTGFLEGISDAISPKKIKLLTMAANHYVEEMDSDVEVRFDVITVIKKGHKFEIEHFENAFYHF